MTVLFVVLIIAVIGAIGLAAVGRLGDLPEPQPDAMGSIEPANEVVLDGEVAFDVVARGYRMSEVDAVVTALQERVAELEAAAGPRPENPGIRGSD